MLIRRGIGVLYEIAQLLLLGVIVLLLGNGIFSLDAAGSQVHRYEAQLNAVAALVERYRVECGGLPARLRDMNLASGNCRPPEQSSRLRDAWGSSYHYAVDGDRFTLRSPGRDRVTFTGDDIVWGDAARSWRAHYPSPTDWLRLGAALATVLLAGLFLATALNLLWRGGCALRRLRWRQRLSSGAVPAMRSLVPVELPGGPSRISRLSGRIGRQVQE